MTTMKKIALKYPPRSPPFALTPSKHLGEREDYFAVYPIPRAISAAKSGTTTINSA